MGGFLRGNQSKTTGQSQGSEDNRLDIFVLWLLEDKQRAATIFNTRCHCNATSAPKYICFDCTTPSCALCSKVVGSSAVVCKSCDSLCLSLPDVKSRARILEDQRYPFGFRDLKLALTYPFRHGITCLGLGLIYGASLFSLPFFNLAYAGILLGSIGLIPATVGTAMTLGCALQIIAQVERGQMDANGIFDVSALLAETWDTVSLGVAIILSLIWPIILAAMLTSIAVVFVVFWPLLAYPAVLAVAASTQRFWPTLNPANVVGTIAAMRSVYLKIFLMELPIVLLTGAGVFWMALDVFSGELNLLAVLILPILAGPLIFYANVVIACLVGRAMFKRPHLER